MKRFDRRWFLRGFGGALIGLPLLELHFNEARAEGPSWPRRFAVFFDSGGTLTPVLKNGTRPDGTGAEGTAEGWAPLSFGETLVPGPIHQVLGAHLDQLLLLRGIDNRAARLGTPMDGDHGWSDVTALTCADCLEVRDSIGVWHTFAQGPSIETEIGNRLLQREPAPYNVIRLQVPGVNYATPFYGASMWPIASVANPVAAFDSLFAGISESGSGAEPAAARARLLRRSILDETAEGVRAFRSRVGAADRQTIDAHLEHLRTLEQRVAALALPMVPGCQKPQVPPSPAHEGEIAEAQVDLMIAALRCGLTHTVALHICDLETLWLNPPLASKAGNAHEFGHLSVTTGATGPDYAVAAAWEAAVLQNRRWRMGLLARFLDGLKAIPEGSGTLLDSTLALWTSEFSNAGAHSSADVPVLLAGGAGGQLRMGRHLNFNLKAVGNPTTREYETKASLHNLYTSILQAFGYSDTHFGNQMAYTTGPLSGLS